MYYPSLEKVAGYLVLLVCWPLVMLGIAYDAWSSWYGVFGEAQIVQVTFFALGAMTIVGTLTGYIGRWVATILWFLLFVWAGLVSVGGFVAPMRIVGLEGLPFFVRLAFGVFITSILTARCLLETVKPDDKKES